MIAMRWATRVRIDMTGGADPKDRHGQGQPHGQDRPERHEQDDDGGGESEPLSLARPVRLCEADRFMAPSSTWRFSVPARSTSSLMQRRRTWAPRSPHVALHHGVGDAPIPADGDLRRLKRTPHGDDVVEPGHGREPHPPCGSGRLGSSPRSRHGRRPLPCPLPAQGTSLGGDRTRVATQFEAQSRCSEAVALAAGPPLEGGRVGRLGLTFTQGGQEPGL